MRRADGRRRVTGTSATAVSTRTASEASAERRGAGMVVVAQGWGKGETGERDDGGACARPTRTAVADRRRMAIDTAAMAATSSMADARRGAECTRSSLVPQYVVQ